LAYVEEPDFGPWGAESEFSLKAPPELLDSAARESWGTAPVDSSMGLFPWSETWNFVRCGLDGGMVGLFGVDMGYGILPLCRERG
jgi:hypothetical protein